MRDLCDETNSYLNVWTLYMFAKRRRMRSTAVARSPLSFDFCLAARASHDDVGLQRDFVLGPPCSIGSIERRPIDTVVPATPMAGVSCLM